MPWPAQLEDFPTASTEPGTVYCTTSLIASKLDIHHRSGQAWKFRGEWRTYLPRRHRAYKSLAGLNPKDPEDFAHIMQSAQAAGLKTPPSSFTDCFLSQFHIPLPRLSPLAPFRWASFGGWEAAFWRGAWHNPVWHYDMNKAYRWASCQGLPDTRTAYRTVRWDDEAYAVYLVELERDARPYAPTAGLHVVTSEEREAFKIRPLRVLAGVGFRSLIDTTETWKKIDAAFPWCFTRISRVFWAAWNSARGPEVCSWKHGPSVRQMANPFHNPIWAAFVTSRVKIRIASFLPQLLHVHVDGILTKEPLPLTGPDVGDFRLLGQYPSLWIRGVSNYGTGTAWLKHAGLVSGRLPAVGEDGRPIT
jgi:hypothetical protein